MSRAPALERCNRPVPAASSVRVSVREIREVSVRALRASGLDAGQASCVADIVTQSEVYEGTGLSALIAETKRIPADPAGFTVSYIGCCAVVNDPVARGPLQIVVPACEAAVVLGQLFVPNISGSSVLDWAARDVAERSACTVELSEVTMSGKRNRMCVATPSGRLLRRTGGRRARITAAQLGGPGLLIRRLDRELPSGGPAAFTTPRCVLRHRTAVEHGVNVDGAAWALACSIARQFLVPQHESQVRLHRQETQQYEY